jgi:catechol 2,3-dioxygenase-like lactoylglutathione lyase family enzyme
MLDHISIGVADIARSKRFYDAALGALDYRCLSEDGASLGYGRDAVAFWLGAVARPVPPDPDSNLHVCFVAPTRQSVDAFHAAALHEGGSDNGRPGLRESYGPNYYAAFMVDPDGYRIEAYCSASA